MSRCAPHGPPARQRPLRRRAMFLRGFAMRPASPPVALAMQRLTTARCPMNTYLIGYAAIVATTSTACTASPPPAAKAARTEQLQCVPGQTAEQEDELVRSTRVLE